MYLVTRLTKIDGELKIIGNAKTIPMAHKLVADHMKYRGAALHARHNSTKPTMAIDGYKAYLKNAGNNRVTVEYTITHAPADTLLSIVRF